MQHALKSRSTTYMFFVHRLLLAEMPQKGSSKVPSDRSWAPLGSILGNFWGLLGASWGFLECQKCRKASQRPPKASRRPPKDLLKASQRHPEASKRPLRLLSTFGDFLESFWRPLRNYANAFRCLPLRFNGYAVMPPTPPAHPSHRISSIPSSIALR